MSKRQNLKNFSTSLQTGIILLYCSTVVVMLLATGKLSKYFITSSLYYQVGQFVRSIPDNGNRGDLIRYLNSTRSQVFFRVTLLDSALRVLYDSYDPKPDPDYLIDHQPLLEAIRIGYSYDEHFSSLTLQEMAYIAIRLNYGGEVMVIRSSFPLDSIQNLQVVLKLTFFALSSFIFFIFILVTLKLISKLNRPLEDILDIVAMKSKEIRDPTSGISLIEFESPPHDFDTLIHTLNNLSTKVNLTLNTLSQERNERESILRSMNEGVLSVSPDMDLIYANPAAIELLELPDNNPSILKRKRYKKIKDLCLRAHAKKEALKDDCDFEKDMRNAHYEIIASPGQENNINLLVRDISIQHELTEMRKGFVANASHELRTPITIIRGFAETLHDHPEITGDTLKDIMGKIVNNCIKMTALITQLMNLSKIENLPEIELKNIDFVKITEETVEQMKSVYPQATITFEQASPQVILHGQETLIGIVVKNLIENAIKYNKDSPKVHITLGAHGNIVELIVRDNGIGIPKEDLPYIFERFYTVDKARTKKVGGFGLGLSMVKTIVDKHKGRIRVSSSMEEGTCFTLHFDNNWTRSHSL